MFTRLTATVTISAPDASCAFTITGGELYLPVPTMSREEKVLSAMVSLSMVLSALLSAADEVHDLHPIAVADERLAERRTLEYDEVVLDGDAARIDLEPAEQLGNGEGTGDVEAVAVQRNLQTVLHFIV